MRVDSVKGMRIGKNNYDRQIWQAMSHNNHTNVVNFRGETPYNLRFRLQENPAAALNNYMVVKIMIGRDSACRVYANRNYTAPLIASDEPDLHSIENRICGQNFYNATDTSLSFVITNQCSIRYKLQNAVKVQMHLNTNYDDFKKNNGKEDFKNKMSSFLNVNTSRVLITNLRSGSVYVDFFITPEDTNSDDIEEDPTAQTAQPTPQDDDLLNSLKDSLVDAVNSGSLDVGSPVLGMETKVVALPNEVPKQPGDDDGLDNNDKKGSKTGLIIGLICGLAILVAGVVVAYKLRSKYMKLGSSFVKA